MVKWKRGHKHEMKTWVIHEKKSILNRCQEEDEHLDFATQSSITPLSQIALLRYCISIAGRANKKRAIRNKAWGLFTLTAHCIVVVKLYGSSKHISSHTLCNVYINTHILMKESEIMPNEITCLYTYRHTNINKL